MENTFISIKCASKLWFTQSRGEQIEIVTFTPGLSLIEKRKNKFQLESQMKCNNIVIIGITEQHSISSGYHVKVVSFELLIHVFCIFNFQLKYPPKRTTQNRLKILKKKMTRKKGQRWDFKPTTTQHMNNKHSFIHEFLRLSTSPRKNIYTAYLFSVPSGNFLNNFAFSLSLSLLLQHKKFYYYFSEVLFIFFFFRLYFVNMYFNINLSFEILSSTWRLIWIFFYTLRMSWLSLASVCACILFNIFTIRRIVWLLLRYKWRI